MDNILGKWGEKGIEMEMVFRFQHSCTNEFIWKCTKEEFDNEKIKYTISSNLSSVFQKLMIGKKDNEDSVEK